MPLLNDLLNFSDHPLMPPPSFTWRYGYLDGGRNGLLP